MRSMEASLENLAMIDGLPTQEEVVRKTEIITKRIQELLISAQENQHERFIPCSEQINGAVREMAQLFPKVIKKKNLFVGRKNDKLLYLFRMDVLMMLKMLYNSLL